ncbi:hypothetical protein [Streptomyces sp. NPDC014734]|uniref:hypothetical protein n=1 Tax=Streptomyces sp. NPDC014734 TaxID=3364886 RepID=UPI0036F5CA5E
MRRLKTRPELYRQLDEHTQQLAVMLSQAARERGIACRAKARNSIFSLTFSHDEPKPYRDRMTGSNFKATIAPAYYMRKHGEYLPEPHSLLISSVHTADDLNEIAQAFGKASTKCSPTTSSSPDPVEIACWDRPRRVVRGRRHRPEHPSDRGQLPVYDRAMSPDREERMRPRPLPGP